VLRRRPGHRHAHRAHLGLGFILAAAAIAGCGGGGETSTYPPGVSQPIGKVEFLREADRICESTNARVQAAGDELVQGRHDPPPAEVRRIVLNIAVPALQTEVEAIGSLGTPAGDEREIKRILDATREGIAQLRANPQSALNGVPPALRRAGRLSRAYGSITCDARNPG
jgi:hypothetical protein